MEFHFQVEIVHMQEMVPIPVFISPMLSEIQANYLFEGSTAAEGCEVRMYYRAVVVRRRVLEDGKMKEVGCRD